MIQGEGPLSAEDSPSNSSAPGKPKKRTLCGILRHRRRRVGCLDAPLEDLEVLEGGISGGLPNSSLKVCCVSPSPVASVQLVASREKRGKHGAAEKDTLNKTDPTPNGNTNLTLCCAMTESSMSSLYPQSGAAQCVVTRRKTGDPQDDDSHRPATHDVGLQVFEELLRNHSHDTVSVDSNQTHGNEHNDSSSSLCSPVQTRKDSAFSSGPSLFSKSQTDNKREAFSSNDGINSSVDEDSENKTAPASLTRTPGGFRKVSRTGNDLDMIAQAVAYDWESQI